MSEERDINFKLAKDIETRLRRVEQHLSIGEDSFDIYFDIFEGGQNEYLYFKLVENSAMAPFYYNISYTIEELYALHDIFRAVNMKQAKEDLESLFKNNLVDLDYENEEKKVILMKMKATLFARGIEFTVKLKKEMIPENEKDDKLLALYQIEKKQIAKAKEWYSVLKDIKDDLDPEIFANFKEHFDLRDKNEVKIQKELDDDQLKRIFAQVKEGKKDDRGYEVKFLNKNEDKNKSWPEGYIEFRMATNDPNIRCKEIIYPQKEIAVGEKGYFYFVFDEDTKPGEYSLIFDVYVGGFKLKDTQFLLQVVIPEEEEEQEE